MMIGEKYKAYTPRESGEPDQILYETLISYKSRKAADALFSVSDY